METPLKPKRSQSVSLLKYQTWVSDFFAKLVQRVSPKSYEQTFAEVYVKGKFLENFAGDQVIVLSGFTKYQQDGLSLCGSGTYNRPPHPRNTAREAEPFSHDPFTHDSRASTGSRASAIEAAVTSLCEENEIPKEIFDTEENGRDHCKLSLCLFLLCFVGAGAAMLGLGACEKG
ncbi:aldehyde/histidinol dehydrogenase [Artemisia annua]|uniref:Aldehyde/histidinol dehydrogenase n=1 Tax=Artemisia annua TaxID=35608 RepID=A0A2U1KX21_ARTAN|nr:aldehyde/histidinol dehydrogenase [Artemisia annua]